MTALPARTDDGGRKSRHLTRAATAQTKTELAIFEHHLGARYQSECQRIDTEALSDVVRAALEEEMSVLDWGMERADGSPAKAQMVGEKVAMLSRINSERIARRFGR